MQHMYACITQPTSVTVLKEVLPPSCTSLQSYMAAGMSDDVFSAVLKRVVAIWEDLFKRGCLHPAFTDNIFMNTSGDMIITSGECIDRHSHGMDELVSLRDVLVITPLRAAYRRHHTTSTSQSPVATTCGEGSTSSRCTCVFIPDVSRSALITGGRRAGRGGHGIVLIGRPSPQLSAAMPHLPPTVAIKQQLRFRSDLRPDGFTAAELFELLIETEVMRAVNDMDGVVKLHGCVTTNAPSGNQFLFIIMEDLSAFYSLVDLAEKGTRPPTKAQLADVVRVVRPIVKELHRRNIAHGDLWKPNVMVRRTALRHAEPLTTNDVRVIDFGESCWFLEPARGRYCDDYKGKIGYEHGVHLTGTALKDYLYARDNDMLEKIYSDAEDSTSTE
jgi:RIO-like serine/threonine protein kinase